MDELGERMSSREFGEWMAFLRIRAEKTSGKKRGHLGSRPEVEGSPGVLKAILER